MNFRGIFAALGIFNDERTKSNEAPLTNSQPDSPDSQSNDRAPDPIRFIDPITITEDSRLTSKDIYRTYWHCRDFELNHLWQRSVFLTAFIVLCFSAYGMLVGGTLDFIKNENFSNEAHFLRWAHGGAIFLSLIGIVLSCLWIMMAKGSKAWYEIYEAAIAAYENDSRHLNTQDADIENIVGFSYRRLKDYDKERHPYNNCWFSPAGGAYSPSRINWGLGWLMLLVWQVLLILHSYLVWSDDCYIAIILAAIIIEAFIFYVISKLFKSKTIENIYK